LYSILKKAQQLFDPNSGKFTRKWRKQVKSQLMKPRVVFMGSPDFAIPSLKRLAEEYPLVGVVTQPDRPAGRGQQITPPPVKQLALELGLSVFQPERLRRPEAFAQLEAWAPDLIVVAAFGQIIRPNVLALPRFGCINVHGSLLPRWRGAAPIQAALLHGDRCSGATIMKMDAGIDTGAVLTRREVEILPEDNTGTLFPRIANAGADLLLATLAGYLSGEIQPVPQDENQATYAPMIKKEEGLLDFTQSAQTLANRVRAFNPWPGASMNWQGGLLKVLAASTSDSTNDPETMSGDRAVLHKLPAVRAADGWLLLDQVQPAGKKAMSGRDFLAGARGWAGTISASSQI
jgi:methionyl-tRNA formyltransferase